MPHPERPGLIRSRSARLEGAFETGSHQQTAYRAADFVFDVDVRVPDPGGTIPRLMSVFGVAPAGRNIARRFVIEADPARAQNYRLLSDDREIPDVTALGTIVDWIIGDVTRSGTASLGRGPALHAGAVAIAGAGVILPGDSGAGKSTLVAGLVAGGARYLSDEVADLDTADRVVHPFPRPLVLDPESVLAVDGLLERIPDAHEEFRLLRYHVTPEDLGSRTAAGPVPLALIVEPHFVRGSGTTLEPLSRAAVLALLAGHVFGSSDAIEGALESLRDIALEVPGYRLDGGDLGEMVGEVQRRASNPTG